MTLRKWLMGWAFAGIAIPALWLIPNFAFGYYGMQSLMLCIYPSSIFLMALDCPGPCPTRAVIEVVSISVAANILLYLLAGLALWMAKATYRRSK
jgi:hypothetical protein